VSRDDHSDSLGVVFVSVAEGTDMKQDLVTAAQQLGIVPNPQGKTLLAQQLR